MLQRAVDTYQRLDVFYNNAGVGYSTQDTHGTVTTLGVEAWDAVVQINLRSVYLCCKYAIPEMIKAGGGSIINTSSIM